jgi:hypothetical protein
MTFPWGQSCVDLVFKCPHCGASQRNEYNTVTLCSCPASEQERIEQHERDAAFQRQQRSQRSMDFQEARETRKLRSNRRGGG